MVKISLYISLFPLFRRLCVCVCSVQIVYVDNCKELHCAKIGCAVIYGVTNACTVQNTFQKTNQKKVQSCEPVNWHLCICVLVTWTHLLLFLCRALFDYDGSLSDLSTAHQALSFHFGDILHVSSAGEEEWWPARHLSPPPLNCPEVGVIPSRRRSGSKRFKTLSPPLFTCWEGNESASRQQLISYRSIGGRQKWKGSCNFEFLTNPAAFSFQRANRWRNVERKQKKRKWGCESRSQKWQ